MISRPLAPLSSASANATGTVGDTECVGGLHIGSKSSTCVAIALRFAAWTTERFKARAPYARLRRAAQAFRVRERERDRRLAAARERDGDAILNRLLDARDAFIAQRLVARRVHDSQMSLVKPTAGAPCSLDRRRLRRC